LINQTNQGVSVARNRGTEASRYEYVAFLDADDEWLPDFLCGIRVLINNFPDCGAYATAVKTIRPNGQEFFPSLANLPLEPWIGILPNFFELFQQGLSAFHPSSIVIPKQALMDVGGFPPGVILMEDIACWIKIAMKYPIAFNPKRLVIYHQEAMNRSNVHKNLKEAPFVNIVLEAIKGGLIYRDLQIEALEFVAKHQIFTAAANIMVGKPVYARQLLSTCDQTKKYKRMWLWWRFWASLPAGWPAKFMILKQKLSG